MYDTYLKLIQYVIIAHFLKPGFDNVRVYEICYCRYVRRSENNIISRHLDDMTARYGIQKTYSSILFIFVPQSTFGLPKSGVIDAQTLSPSISINSRPKMPNAFGLKSS